MPLALLLRNTGAWNSRDLILPGNNISGYTSSALEPSLRHLCQPALNHAAISIYLRDRRRSGIQYAPPEIVEYVCDIAQVQEKKEKGGTPAKLQEAGNVVEVRESQNTTETQHPEHFHPGILLG